LACRTHDYAVAAFPLPTGRARKLVLAILALVVLIGALLAGKAWRDTMGDPIVRTTTVILPDLPAGTQPVTVALLADIHMSGPDMPPERVERIVAQVNRLKPDLILVAGDLVSDSRLVTHIYRPEEIVAPLAALRAPLGVILVPGNHDHWYDWPALKAELDGTDIVVLENAAHQTGPLAIGGLDDEYTGHDDIPKMLRALRPLDGARVILSHGPDPAPDLPEGSVVLAGHTHCGQIRFPLIGALGTPSRYGERFECGRIDEGTRTIIVSAGIGTSIMPVRFNTRPEVWLIELRPPEKTPTAAN